MGKSADWAMHENTPSNWLTEELFLKLHLELTLLAMQKGEREDIAADVASQCLIDVWMAASSDETPFLIKPFLIKRLACLLKNVKKVTQKSRAVESEYLAIQRAGLDYEYHSTNSLSQIIQFSLHLEPLEQQLIQLLLVERLELEQIAIRWQFPFSKVKRLYKHSTFRLRKLMGQWKPYQ